MVLKMLLGSMKMLCKESTRDFLKNFEILIYVLYMH
jgi:hypothetical protein